MRGPKNLEFLKLSIRLSSSIYKRVSVLASPSSPVSFSFDNLFTALQDLSPHLVARSVLVGDFNINF